MSPWSHLLPPQPQEPAVGGNLPAVHAEGARLADAFVAAWADAVAADPPPGPVVRLRMVWSTDGFDRYFAPSLTGEGDSEIASPDPDDPWEEIGSAGERGADQAFAIMERAEIDELLDAFHASLPSDPDDPEELHPEFDDTAITAAVARRITLAIEPALRKRGVPVAERYAILIQPTDGAAALDDFVALNSAKVRGMLADAGQLPRFWDDDGEMLPVGTGG